MCSVFLIDHLNRREVLRDHLGVRGRSNEQRTETQDSTTQDVPLSEVSPDFLAALPSDIQEEVQLEDFLNSKLTAFHVLWGG